jgi:DNA-binding transcriptional MerR regulator
MSSNGIFTVGEFANLLRVKRTRVINYDKLGLLSPHLRRDNNYRYYSSDQLALLTLICAQMDFAVPLDTIKRSKERRTPERTAVLLEQLRAQFDEKILNMHHTRELIATLEETIKAVSGINEQEITVRDLDEAPIVLGSMNDFSNGKNDYDALRAFYDEVCENSPDINFGYPVWALFSEKRIRQGDWVFPDRYYFYSPAGQQRRPGGQYAVGYARGGYGQTDGLYKRLLGYIEQNNLEICGDSYEEYPLNEVCIADDTNYLIRIMVPVRTKRV